jgi:outer membrane protein insertion porin family
MGILLAFALFVAQAQQPLPLAPQAPSPASAFAGREVVRTEITIDGVVTDEAMLVSLVETPVGEPLAMALVRETIAHIYSIGRFQEISVEAIPAGAGVALRYNLVPLQTVERVQFRGNLGLGSSELRRAVTDQFGAAPQASRASNVAEMLQGYYFDRGYLAAAIRPNLEDEPGRAGAVLTFEIESGARASVREVTVDGDPGVPRDQFLREVHADPGRVYQRYEVQGRLTEFVEDLRHTGRFEARASHRILRQSDDGQSVDLLIAVDPGPAVTIRYEGDPLPKDHLDELVPLMREGSADADILEDSEQRIVQYLNQQGYWKASAKAQRNDLDGRVEIVFTVSRGPQYRIAGDPEVSGNASVPIDVLRPALENLKEGELFVAGQLQAAASAIRGIYLRRGFAQVKVDPAPDELDPTTPGEGRVRPVIVISEGSLLRIGEITFSGNTAFEAGALSGRIVTAPGQPYYEPQVIQDRETILTAYLNEGYATASVTVVPQVGDDSTVDIRFEVSEGPQSIVDHVLIVGNVRTDPRVIEREVQLRAGEPLGLDDLFETRRRLGALGLFRRIRITEIPHGESNRRDVLIALEEAPLTSIGYGGGLELSERLVTGPDGSAEERLDLAPRGFFEIGRRNLGGRNRSVSLYTRLALRSGSDTSERDNPLDFPEYRVVGTYREPRTFGWNADVTITGALEQGVRSTFKFARKGVNAEMLRQLSPTIRVSGRYTLGTTRTFDEILTEEEQATIDRIFPQVRLSVLSAAIGRDTRDDPLDPTRGFFVTGEGSLAARSLGGQVGFLRSFVQGQAYRQLPFGRRSIVAGRIAIGLADGFPYEVSVVNPDGSVETQIVEDLPASERFFAGGDSTMRGFALDSVGTPATITESGFPRGGNGLLLFNGEIRVPVWRDLGAAVFIDAGNVFDLVENIDFGEMRAAAGIGLRYRSPVGPLRFDVGFKLDRRVIGGQLESPRAFHFSFGQAF